MSVTHVVGVDPGLVHTGVVRLVLDPHTRTIQVSSRVILGADIAATRDWINHSMTLQSPRVFIEGYRPRSHFQQDQRMVVAVRDLHLHLPGSRVVDNTGVKKVVRRTLMHHLGCWNFSTPTHHQDLRSAARIAIYGMLKDSVLNELLADVIRDSHESRGWQVTSS